MVKHIGHIQASRRSRRLLSIFIDSLRHSLPLHQKMIHMNMSNRWLYWQTPSTGTALSLGPTSSHTEFDTFKPVFWQWYSTIALSLWNKKPLACRQGMNQLHHKISLFTRPEGSFFCVLAMLCHQFTITEIYGTYTAVSLSRTQTPHKRKLWTTGDLICSLSQIKFVGTLPSFTRGEENIYFLNLTASGLT